MGLFNNKEQEIDQATEVKDFFNENWGIITTQVIEQLLEEELIIDVGETETPENSININFTKSIMTLKKQTGDHSPSTEDVIGSYLINNRSKKICDLLRDKMKDESQYIIRFQFNEPEVEFSDDDKYITFKCNIGFTLEDIGNKSKEEIKIN